jgi:hypothetical protein
MSFIFYLVSFIAGIISLVVGYPPALGVGIICSLIGIIYENAESDR